MNGPQGWYDKWGWPLNRGGLLLILAILACVSVRRHDDYLVFHTLGLAIGTFAVRPSRWPLRDAGTVSMTSPQRWHDRWGRHLEMVGTILILAISFYVGVRRHDDHLGALTIGLAVGIYAARPARWPPMSLMALLRNKRVARFLQQK